MSRFSVRGCGATRGVTAEPERPDSKAPCCGGAEGVRKQQSRRQRPPTNSGEPRNPNRSGRSSVVGGRNDDLVLSNVINVHVVGDNTALFTAGGALLGVIVGLGGSWLQQRSKIGADKVQLERQLQHDRDSKEMETVRRVLDEASIALEEHSHILSNLIRVGRRSEPDQEILEGLEALQRAAVIAARGSGARIALWFDPNDPTATTFDVAQATTAELIPHMRKGEFEKATELNDKLDDQIEDFQRAARARMAAEAHAARSDLAKHP
jgi:hypothetical protein